MNSFIYVTRLIHICDMIHESYHPWMSHVTFEMSHVTFEISHVIFEMSHVTFEMSHVTFEMSHVTFETSPVSRDYRLEGYLQKQKSPHYYILFIEYSNVQIRPTQSIMYVPVQVNRSQKCILLIVQYKYLKSCSGNFLFSESDPPHKIMCYWVYYSTQLCFGFPPDRICQVEMICTGGVPVLKRHFGGAGP